MVCAVFRPVMGFAVMGAAPTSGNSRSVLQSLRSFGLRQPCPPIPREPHTPRTRDTDRQDVISHTIFVFGSDQVGTEAVSAEIPNHGIEGIIQTSKETTMKHRYIFLLVFCFSAVFAIKGRPLADEFPYPGEQELAKAQAGDLVMKASRFPFKGQEVDADFGTLVVPENRRNPLSRLIRLPVVRIHATEKKSDIPIFTFQGGPGAPNITKGYSKWLYQHQDIVMVGYRGVDGATSLACPEIAEAMQVDSNPLSTENLEKLGQAMYAGFQRLKKQGIDIDSYTVVDVVDDIEMARKAMGYEKINLWGHSYGTQVAYVYSVKYPDSVLRSLISGASAIGKIWTPDIVDKQLSYYAELWRKNPACVSRTPDLLGTIQTVIERLPTDWHGIVVDAGKVKMMTFLFLADTGTSAQLFDAFVAAEGGDYSGLAYLSAAYNQTFPKILNWGDVFSKLLSSSDAHARREYGKEKDPPGTIIGSPLEKLFFVPQKHGGWPIRPIPEEYKNGITTVETVVVNGSIDFSSPSEYARDYLLPKLSNCKTIFLSEMGHHDIYNLQEEAYRHLYDTFFLTGEVDDSKFRFEPMNFTPAKTLQNMAQALIK